MAREILLYGGSGRLGEALKICEPSINAPTHGECDITNIDKVIGSIDRYHPDIVINCAALVGTKECEVNRGLARLINVDGAINVARVCQQKGLRYVFISSAAIFDGKKGQYFETDEPSPVFYYAQTKVEAERYIKGLQNYVIVRLDFFSQHRLKYNRVLVDHYTSKISVSEAAEKILRVADSDFVGIINVGQARKSLYNILKPFYPEIEPIKIEDSALPDFPRDISLSLDLWRHLFGDS